MGRLACAVAFVVLVATLAGCRAAAPVARPTRVPDPLPLPAGAPPLTKESQRAMYRALAAAERGDREVADREVRRLPENHPATRLVALEVGFLLGERVADEVAGLLQKESQYLQLLTFAAQAWEAEGRYREALAPARQALQLSGDPTAARRVRELERRVLEAALTSARAALANADPGGAIAIATEALALVPGALPLLEVLVRAHLAEDNVHLAARLVPSLPDDGEGLELKGRVAAAGQQWEVAAEMFARLPAGYPGRCALLIDARRRARLAQAPPYVQRALASENLTRAGLAALVVWEVPALAESARGLAGIFEDIVNLSERRDVVTVVRAGVMEGDPVTRRFFPHRPVRDRELVVVAERLAAAIGQPQPEWCGEDRRAGCLELPREGLTGATVASLLRRVAGGGNEGCH